jgi:hypothetical protein
MAICSMDGMPPMVLETIWDPKDLPTNMSGQKGVNQ